MLRRRCTAASLVLLLAGSIAPGKGLDQAPSTASVVFYSHGSFWKSGLPGTNTGIFYGNIFDGDSMMAHFLDGYYLPKNNRVIEFHLAPGEHDFSAGYGKHAPKKHVHMTLVAGQRYFLRAQSESRGIIEIEIERGRLDEVPCQTAASETATAKLLPQHSILKQFLPNVAQDSLPIICQ